MSTVLLQKELSYDEAVRVLGFEPGTIVSPHISAFRDVERKLGELIETTKDDQLRTNFREELERLNEALRVVEADSERHEPSIRRKGMGVRALVSLLLVACLVGVAWWVNTMVAEERATRLGRGIERLAVEGKIAVENRRWPDAEEIYERMERLQPGSLRARDGFRSIEEGKEEVRRQKIGFLTGSTQAAIDQRDWEQAEENLKELQAMVPDQADIPILFEKIEDGRVFDKVVKLLEGAEEALRDKSWEELVARTAELEKLAPQHVELARLQLKSAEGMKLMEAGRIKARELYKLAISLDEGSFSQEALDALREAIRLDSQEEDYRVLYEKMSSYARVLEVPSQFPTISGALKEARSNDKIRVAAGTYKESLVLRAKVDLEGAGVGKTIVEFEAKEGGVVVAGKEASGSRVAGMLLRQIGIALTEERFPVVTIEDSELSLEDCAVENGSGHGVAVLAGGTGRLRNVRVLKSGWDGLAVYGQDSRAVVNDSRFEANLHHGIDVWDEGRVEVTKSRSTLNGLTGVVLMARGVKSVLTQCTSDRNREVGILVSNASRGELMSNRAEANLLGGILIEGEETEAWLEGNVVERNLKVGIVADKRSTLVSFKNNTSQGNSGEQLNLKADLPQEAVDPPPLLKGGGVDGTSEPDDKSG